jgi:hypothetical protein
MYSSPAQSTERMRQLKCEACQVPAASSRFTKSITSATSSSSTEAWAPGTTAPMATIRCRI